jgi:TolB protein
MLAAGQTGSRSDIPWSLIGPGWTLAEVSTAQPASNGSAIGGIRLTYLVDPEGGKYRIRTMSGAAQPDLLAWSGNGKEALYAFPGAPGSGAMSYSLLGLATGNLRALLLPAGVAALGFTRPDGLNILAVHLMNSKYRLERYDLAGAFQAAIGTLPRPGGTTGGIRINALSSPDGTTAVWGVSGDGMELVSNAGGLIRKLRVPGAGSPRSCTPMSWWSADSVLTYCNAAGQPDAGRLWVVPAGGGQPTQLTGISGAPSGQGAMTGAWQTGGTVYITSTTFAQCQGAPSGPGGMQILQLGNGGTETAVSIPATTDNHVDIVSGLAGRLLVQAQTSCPGTYSLIWFNPSTHAAQAVLTAPPTEAGVISAVPYGAGEAAAG